MYCYVTANRYIPTGYILTDSQEIMYSKVYLMNVSDG